MARQFPGIVAHAVRLGGQAGRGDTVATITASLAAGVFTGAALLASISVPQALFAAGPTPGRAGLTTRVQLSAFDDAAFNDAMLRARDRECWPPRRSWRPCSTTSP